MTSPRRFHRACHALLVFLVLVSGLAAQTFPAKAGLLDLRTWAPEASPVIALEGQWEFVWQKLVSPDGLDPGAALPGSSLMQVPSTWSSGTGGYPNWGYATYRLRVLLPARHPVLAIRTSPVNMAHDLWVNGKLVEKSGQPGTTPADYSAAWVPDVHLLEVTGDSLDIVVRIANFDDHDGGMANSFALGEARTLFHQRQANTMVDLMLFGALVLMGLYYLGLFLFRRVDRSSLYFCLLCLSLGIRQLCYGEVVIHDILPGLPFIVTYRLGYLLYCTGLFAFARFLRELFPAESWKVATRVTDGVILAYFLCCLAAPSWVFPSLLQYFQVFTLAVGIWSIICLVRAILAKRPGSLLLLSGFLLMFAAVIHDMAKGYLSLPTPFLLPFGVLAFIFVQSLILTRKFAGAFAASERFALHLEHVNQSLERFIPKEVLAFLEKDSIVDIHLGDHLERDMSVMFADIRSFTSLSEQMTPRENFNFINSYLQRMGPLIRKHHGFVDKYLGDGIMALFPGKPDQALKAVLEMKEALVEYNLHRAKQGYQAIRVGFGIHAGNVMMGTIGESQRMDSTVISDAVNIASRLEGLTKKYDLDFLISDQLIARLEKPEEFDFRFLDEETVKGKKVPVRVFELVGYRKTTGEN